MLARRFTLVVVVALVVLIGSASAWQMPFRQYPGIEHEDEPLPPDYTNKTSGFSRG